MTRDDNGAIHLEAFHQQPKDQGITKSSVDISLGRILGAKIAEHFPAELRKSKRNITHKLKLVVMTEKDYKELAEKAWKYDDLQD